MSIKQSLNSCSLPELRELMHKLGHPDFEWTADQVLELQYDEEIAVWIINRFRVEAQHLNDKAERTTQFVSKLLHDFVQDR